MNSSQIEPSFDYVFKYIIIGETCVGKSCLLLQFLQNKFKLEHDSTIGVQFGSKVVNVKNIPLKLQVWDTAGQQTFKSITRSYYRGSIGVILVYDVTDKQSFGNIEEWLRETKDFANDKVSIMLVGNKIDLVDRRCISNNQGKELATKQGIQFIQTSAKTGQNVDKVFTLLAEAILKKIQSKQIDPLNNILGIKLSEEAEKRLKVGNRGGSKKLCC